MPEPASEPQQEIESIERRLQFVEPETDVKKTAVEEELAYLEKPSARPTYLQEPGKKGAEGREYVSSSAAIENIDTKQDPDQGLEFSGYRREEEDLEEYVPSAEIQSKSLKKEEYKRKKIV